MKSVYLLFLFVSSGQQVHCLASDAWLHETQIAAKTRSLRLSVLTWLRLQTQPNPSLQNVSIRSFLQKTSQKHFKKTQSSTDILSSWDNRKRLAFLWQHQQHDSDQAAGENDGKRGLKHQQRKASRDRKDQNGFALNSFSKTILLTLCSEWLNVEKFELSCIFDAITFVYSCEQPSTVLKYEPTTHFKRNFISLSVSICKQIMWSLNTSCKPFISKKT